jgi:hypothetical protein
LTAKRPHCTAGPCATPNCLYRAWVDGWCKYCHPTLAVVPWEERRRRDHAARVAEARQRVVIPPGYCRHILLEKDRHCQHRAKASGYCDIHDPVLGPKIKAREGWRDRGGYQA